MTILQWWNDFTNKGLPSGTYAYIGHGKFKGHRFHLRVDGEQKGVLMVDAAKLLFLNGTALDYVRCILEQRDDKKTVKYMRHRYRKLSGPKALKDLKKVKAGLSDFFAGNTDFISSIGPATPTVAADKLPAPYRMDLALTYKCQNECAHCYNETKDKKELSLESWKSVLDKLWKLGIPHVVFTGGEPTLSPNLKELIAHAQKLGQVTGLITNGRNLKKIGYLGELVSAGLDHVQITLLSHRESVHDRLTGVSGSWKDSVEGLKRALREQLYVSTNTTILPDNLDEIEDTLKFIMSLGTKNIAFNAIIRSGKGKEGKGIDAEKLGTVMDRLKALADAECRNLIWYAPTPYCEFNPVNHGLGIKQCTACSVNMAIEPDGTVIPCQSCYEPLGNILKDDWHRIWNHKRCKEFRERGYLPEKCDSCDMLNLCGGGCPLSIEHGDYLCIDRHSNP